MLLSLLVSLNGRFFIPIPEYEFLLSPINHMRKIVNEKEIQYTSQLAISEHDFSFLSVRMLRFLLSKLVDLGMEIIVFRNDNGYAFKDFGIKNLIYKNKKDTRKNLVAKQLLPDKNY